MSAVRGTSLENCTALVTGGLGFIGSALTRALVARKARVRVLDSLLPQSGGSPLNIAGLADEVEVVIEDVRSRDVVDHVVRGCDLVFHFAGSSGPKAFGSDMYSEIDIACLGTLNVLEGVRIRAPRARLVYASSFHVYGRPSSMPVAETAPTDPHTIFGVHKLTAEKYCGAYAGLVDSVAARLSTIVGPRQRLQAAPAGTVAHIIDAALHGDEINLRQHGTDELDFLYVDDAVEALLVLATANALPGRVVNVGSGTATRLHDVATMVTRLCGRGSVCDDDSRRDAFRFVADVSRLRALGVRAPARSVADALRETVRWFTGNASADAS